MIEIKSLFGLNLSKIMDIFSLTAIADTNLLFFCIKLMLVLFSNGVLISPMSTFNLFSSINKDVEG